MVDIEYEKRLDDVLIEIRELLKRKHSDYGNDNLLRFGLFGIVVRMSDKLARIENLISKKTISVVEETMYDTFLDLAGYSIQAIILFFGKMKQE